MPVWRYDPGFVVILRASSLMHPTATYRHAVLALVVFFLAACGGKNDATTHTAPTPSVRYPAAVPVSALVTLDGTGSVETSGGTLIYSWTLTSKPAGSTATISAPTAAQVTFTADVIGTYMVTLKVDDGFNNQSVSIAVVASAYTPPTIQSDIVEPVSGTVQLSLSSDPGTSTVNWTVDGVAIGTGATVSWDTTGVANGSHLVVANVQTISDYAINLSRTFQVTQSAISFPSAAISESAGAFTSLIVPQSTNGIQRVSATFDGIAAGTLATPNACTDPTYVACAAALNAYAFDGTVNSGQHVLVVTATDGAGNSLGIQLRLTVTDVP